MASVSERRVGRPPKVDDDGVATRDRLLRAAVASCVEFGFDGATVVDIAARAGVSAPAIYNHFGGKVELLVAAARWELARLAPRNPSVVTAAPDVVRAFLSAEFLDHASPPGRDPRRRRQVSRSRCAARRVACRTGDHVGLGVRNGRRRSGEDVLRPAPRSLPHRVALRAAGFPVVTGAMRGDARRCSLSVRRKPVRRRS